MASFAPRARLRAIAALVAAAGTAGCTGRTLTLGDRDPRPYHFEVPQVITELRSDARTDNPTLTADLLEIFFTSDRTSGNGDVWSARRSDVLHPFSPPAPVTEVNTSTFETSSAISADGLTLWFGSDRPTGVGSTDIWVASRPSRSVAWMTPVNVLALNTAAEDIPRPPGQHNLVMPMSSKTATSAVYQTFFATRPSAGAPFGMPVLVSELADPNNAKSTVDAFLTDDGLTMFYSSAPAVAPADAATPDGGMPTADLYVAFRRSVDERFVLAQPLDDLNTPADERDPFLTPDGKTLYFTSDRDGALNIYTASVKPR